MSLTSRQVHLAARPEGEPRESDFRLVTVDLPYPGAGEVLVRNDWMSLDPAVRGRMRGVRTYVAPFELDQPLEGAAVGTVVASGDQGLPVGAVVRHRLGWREHALLASTDVEVLDVERAAPEEYLSVLGMTGLTAYVGLTQIAPVRAGDVVFVSAAAGAVGLAAGAVARRLGAARVVGSAGGPAKARLLVEELGYDSALDHRQGDLPGQLAAAAPDGVDVYFDNVGGDHLEAALGALRVGGRVALCGAISQYNATSPAPGPANMGLAITKRLTMRGFIVLDHADLRERYEALAAGWLRDGVLPSRKTVVHGLDQAPRAFLDLLRGVNVGKMLVRLS